MKIYFDYAQPGSLWRFIKRNPDYKWLLHLKIPSSNARQPDIIYIPHTVTVMALGDITEAKDIDGTFYKVMSEDSFGACRIGWMHESSAQGLEPYIL